MLDEARVERRDGTHLVVGDAVERRLGAAGPTADAQRLAVGKALSVRDLRLEGLELALGHVERRRLEAKGVETCREQSGVSTCS